jgi:hypothetical protein
LTNIILMVVIFMVALVVLMLASIWYMNFLLKHLVGKKHEAIEFILNTTTAPISWSKKYNQKMVAFDQLGGHNPEIKRVQNRAKKVYLRKIDKLIRYMKISNLVEDENARNQVISQLEYARSQWEKGEDLGWTTLGNQEEI